MGKVDLVIAGICACTDLVWVRGIMSTSQQLCGAAASTAGSKNGSFGFDSRLNLLFGVDKDHLHEATLPAQSGQRGQSKQTVCTEKVQHSPQDRRRPHKADPPEEGREKMAASGAHETSLLKVHTVWCEGKLTSKKISVRFGFEKLIIYVSGSLCPCCKLKEMIYWSWTCLHL